jgi:ribosomal protein S27AE
MLHQSETKYAASEQAVAANYLNRTMPNLCGESVCFAIHSDRWKVSWPNGTGQKETFAKPESQKW